MFFPMLTRIMNVFYFKIQHFFPIKNFLFLVKNIIITYYLTLIIKIIVYLNSKFGL